MYTCQVCKSPSQPRETQHKLVVETRKFHHKERQHAHPQKNGEGRHDPGGHGTQIVREVNACTTCKLKADAQALVSALPAEAWGTTIGERVVASA